MHSFTHPLRLRRVDGAEVCDNDIGLRGLPLPMLFLRTPRCYRLEKYAVWRQERAHHYALQTNELPLSNEQWGTNSKA